MSDRIFRLALDAAEIEALIKFHAANMMVGGIEEKAHAITLETSQRIHDLMKRLHRGSEPEISNDPRPPLKEGESTPIPDHDPPELETSGDKTDGWN